MASFDDFLPDIMPDVGTCPPDTVRREVLQAAIHFCRTTQAWTEMLDPSALINKMATYSLDLPSDSRLIMVREVWAPDRQLLPRSLQEVARRYPNWQVAQGAPEFYNMLTWNELRIYPIPIGIPKGFAITVRAALAPTNTAKVAPDVLAERWRDAIIARAKSQLMIMRDKPWTDVNTAAIHAGVYRTECDLAGAERINDGVSGGGTVHAVSFGGVR